MISITKYVQSVIENGKRIVQVIVSGKKNTQNALEAGPFGFDSQAPKGMRAIFAKTANKSKKVIIGYINENQLAKEGESRQYSINSSGEVVMFLYMKNDGTAEFNGDDDFLVRFSKLELGFNELRTDHNVQVSKFNLHAHPIPLAQAIAAATVPASGVPAISGTPSNANISDAKITKIKTCKNN